MAAPKPLVPLRYPKDEIHKTTDYLQIDIKKYVASGTGTSDIDPDLLVEKVNPTGQTVLAYGDKFSNLGPGSLAQRRAAARQLGATSTRFNLTRPSERNLEKPNGKIYLPIPSNIQDGNSVKYTEGSLDGLTAKALGIAINAFNQGKDNQVIGKIISDALKSTTNALVSPEVQRYFLDTLASQAANVAGGNLTASQLLSRQSGNIINPNMELLFDGVTLRSFKFSFKMTPRNGKEAKEIKDIIRLLKRTMSPGLGGTVGPDNTKVSNDFYLNTPNLYQLSYKRGPDPHPFLHKFKPCFLTDMSVNYTGEGTYAVYGDSADGGGGTPVSMIMDLGFKEVEPIYSQDYNDETDIGVGY